MTPKRPTEVSQASIDISEAWNRYDAFVEACDKVGAKCAWDALEMIEERYNTLYQEWQILGGTSNIDSLTFPAPYVDILHAEAMDNDTRQTMEDARY
jgi:hypothetical protein